VSWQFCHADRRLLPWSAEASVREDWHDPEWARAWDARVDANPIRAEHLDLVVSTVAAAHRPGTAILDLGAGSGKLEALLLATLPAARLVGIDSSEVMLALARERLGDAMDRVVLLLGDFSALDAVALPQPSYPIIVSVQALHHVPDADKRRVFEWVVRRLEPGGLFVLMDRIATLRHQLRALARVLAGRLAVTMIGAREHDHPSTVATHLRLLREAGFDATCVRCDNDRAVFTAGARSTSH
jgi:SAM-dependent methyltransferase